MFLGAEGFNGNIGQWNVSKVTNMTGTFREAKTFNGDVSKWNVDQVTTMQSSKSIRIFENDLLDVVARM